MAPRKLQQISGVPLADLPDGETTFRISKEHRSDYEPQALSREETARYPHRICKFADGQFSYLGNSPAGPLQMEELASRYGPGLYQQTPIDPQTRQPIEALQFEVKILPPDPAPFQHTQLHQHLPAAQPAPIDTHTQLLIMEKERQERLAQELRAEQERIRSEQREAAAEARQRDQERWDRMMALGSTLLTALPALAGVAKTFLAPQVQPQQQAATTDPALIATLESIRKMLADKKEPDDFEKLQKVIVTKQLTETLASLAEKPTEDDDLGKFERMATAAAPVVTAVLDRVSPPQQAAAPSPLSSPDALIAEIVRIGPDRAGEVLRKLGAQHPEVAQMAANSLLDGVPKQPAPKPRLHRADDEAA